MYHLIQSHMSETKTNVSYIHIVTYHKFS